MSTGAFGPESLEEPVVEVAEPEVAEDEGLPVEVETDADEAEAITPFDDAPVWDPERQRRDQDHANEVKKLRSEIDEMRSKLQEPPAATPQPKVDSLEEEANALVERASKLDEDSDPAEVAEAVKEMGKALKKLASAKTKVDDSQALSEVEKLKQQLAQERELEQESLVQKQYAEMLAKYDGQYGAENRNAAYSLVQKELAKRGYDNESNRPSLDLLDFMFREGYREASTAAKKGKQKSSLPTKEAFVDPGVGGTGVVQPVKTGSFAEIGAAMRKEGKVR